MKQIDEFTVELTESDCRDRIAQMATVLGITVEQAMLMTRDDDAYATIAGVTIFQMRFLLGE